MKSAHVVCLCGVLSLGIAGVTCGLVTKYTEVRQVGADVSRLQWTCRTSVMESYTWLMPVVVGKSVILIPTMGWRVVASSDAMGDGYEYRCSRYSTAFNQHESFNVAFFVTFTDQTGSMYQYPVSDFNRFKSFTVGSYWTLGLNKSGEIVSVLPPVTK